MSIESVMLSSHLILCRPLLLLPPIPPSIRVFSNDSTLHMRWPKYWSFSFSISPSNEHPGLISFRVMDLTFQVPMQYCSLQHRTLLLSPVTSTTGYCFLLWLHPFILSGVISPLISCSILGTYLPGEFIFQCPIFLPFHTFMGFSGQEY